MSSVTIKEFYQDILGGSCPDIDQFLNENINSDIGHLMFLIYLKYTAPVLQKRKCLTTAELTIKLV